MSSVVPNLELNSICRVCMCQEPKLVNIFSSTALFSSISSVIMECVPISISETDSLPHTICEMCIEKLENVYSFRSLCLNSDAVLRGYGGYTQNSDFKVPKQEVHEDTLNTSPIPFNESIDSDNKSDLKDTLSGLEKDPIACSSPNSENDFDKVVKIKKKRLKKPKEEKNKGTNKVKNKIKTCPILPDAEGFYNCETCSKKFKQKYHLKRHMVAHTDIRLPCEICGRKFVRTGDLQSHMKTHSTARTYSCEYCGLTFRTRSVLLNHRTIHLNIRPYECTHCEKKFRLKIGLENHLRTHTGERPFACEKCGKQFKRKDHLMAHEQIHKDPQIRREMLNIRPYKCEICEKSFRLRRLLKNHMRIHTGERPFICETCGRTFNRKHHLSTHEQTHGERRFKCDICPQRFISKKNLNQHVTKHHKTPIKKVEWIPIGATNVDSS